MSTHRRIRGPKETGGVPVHLESRGGLAGTSKLALWLTPLAVLAVAITACATLRPGTVREAVSTSVNHAYPIASWLTTYTADHTPMQAATFDLQPGYHRFLIQSYCLHAGTYAPTEGDGYLIAPLLGERAEIVRNVLQRTAHHPGIEQRDIQRLLWGIEAGARFTDFDPLFQVRIAPLLTAQDIAALGPDFNVIAAELLSLLPADVRRQLQLYDRMRSLVTDLQTSYEEIEAVAVVQGAAPAGPGSREIGPGPWAYSGDGFYVRVFPRSYSQTVLEVIRPAPYALTRDEKGRIRTFQSGGYSIEVAFDDSPNPIVVTAPEKPGIPIWQIASIRFIGPNEGEELIYQGLGWMLSPRFDDSDGLTPSSPPSQDTPSYEEVERVLAAANALDLILDEISRYRELQGREGAIPLELLRDVRDLRDVALGLPTGVPVGDPASLDGQLGAHLQRVSDAWNYATCAAAGDCTSNQSAVATELQLTNTFDPSNKVAAPANTSRQRLGLSPRQECPGGCDDGIACTMDQCVPGLGCTHVPVATACDDGIECTADACAPGIGCTHTPVASVCDDGIACTQDECVPGTGCRQIPVADTCDDGKECTRDECDAGQGCRNVPDDNIIPENQPADDCLACRNGEVVSRREQAISACDALIQQVRGTCESLGGDYVVTVEVNQNGSQSIQSICGGGSCFGEDEECEVCEAELEAIDGLTKDDAVTTISEDLDYECARGAEGEMRVAFKCSALCFAVRHDGKPVELTAEGAEAVRLILTQSLCQQRGQARIPPKR